MVGSSSSSSKPAFVQALDNMYAAYDGNWPPRASFSDWPLSFLPYQSIADEMPEKLYSLNDAQLFRAWMDQQLSEKVNVKEVMRDIEAHLAHNDKVLFGLSAALAYLVNSYRWATLPPTDMERLRLTLTFPEKIWAPFEKINNFYGMVQRGSVYTLVVANCIYNDRDEPEDMRFYFNHDLEIRQTEKNFFLSFLHMELTWKPALHKMGEFLLLTEQARQSKDQAFNVLDRRVQLLQDIRKTLAQVSKMFHNYMKDNMVSVKYWADYVQSMPSWNINGVDGGASGGESLTFHSLDEFLGTLGKGVIFQGGKKKRLGVPTLYRQCMLSLADDSRCYRFDSFVDSLDGKEHLRKAHDDLISMLYTWRLFHTKVAPRYLANSRMTSGGSVDKAVVTGETLAQRGEVELRERARETAVFLSPDRRPKSIGYDLDHLEVTSVSWLQVVSSKVRSIAEVLISKFFSLWYYN